MGRYFYRVFDETSVSRFSESEGFKAGRSTGTFKPHLPKAKKVVQQHKRWENRKPSPFISVTRSRAKAVHYARQRREWGRDDVQIAKIDRTSLRNAGVTIYHMATLVERIGAHIDSAAWNWTEYLCLYHIPSDAVVAVKKFEC